MPRILAFIAAIALSVSAPVFAQAWPAKPVRVIVPFAAGGSLDFVTRLLGERLAQDLGQPVVIENRVGANGNIGAEYVAKQAPDGYVVLASADALTSSAHLYKLAYNPMKDLVPVVQFTRQPLVLAVHPSLGVTSVAELLVAAKAKPGIGFATSGAGSGQHIAGEWLGQLAGVKFTHIPYKGGGQAIGDLVSGQVQMASLGSGPVMPHYRAGKVRIIAQSTATRAPSLPEVPTYREAGLRNLVLDQWLGLFVPAGTPAPIVQRLNASIARILQDPAIVEKLAPQALEAVGGTPEQFATLYRDDFEKYGRLVKELGIRLD